MAYDSRQLVNSTVGPYGPKLFHNIAVEDLDQIVVKQMMAPILTSRLVWPWMRERKCVQRQRIGEPRLDGRRIVDRLVDEQIGNRTGLAIDDTAVPKGVEASWSGCSVGSTIDHGSVSQWGGSAMTKALCTSPTKT